MRQMSMAEIGLVHLVRARNGPQQLQTFIESYRVHPAGVAHDLLFVFKGFTDAQVPAEYNALLRGLSYEIFFVPDRGFDIEPYLAVARAFEHRFFCFLNSFSVVLADDWLAKLRAHIGANVGSVGATGSHESHYTNAQRATSGPLTYLRRVLGYSLRGRRPQSPTAYLAQRRELQLFKQYFAPFPNHHIRTNAFLMAREVLLRLACGAITNKMDAMRFESGKAGLTRQLSALSLRTLVVGRDGRAYEPERWCQSHTFRSGLQENLLVADNRTREYATADAATKKYLCEVTWGAEVCARASA
jgi:hypothetical protein